MKKLLLNPFTRRVIFAACLIPALLLVVRGFKGNLSANPVEFLEHSTGDWALRFLCITLAVTPLRKIFDQPLFIRYRRMLGLFAFFYTCVHLALYLTFDLSFQFRDLLADVLKRPYITFGMAGFLMMAPLAITSTAAMVRRMGPKRWQLLHRLVYFSTLAGVIHYYWLVKSNVREPLMYAGIFALLMLYRVMLWTTKGAKPQKSAPVTA